jgi:hypothetical protein
MSDIFITDVRRSEGQGDQLLAEFVHNAGMYARLRPPRGIEPEQVGKFLGERLKADDPWRFFEQAAKAARYYERAEAVPVCVQALSTTSGEFEDIMRANQAARMIGDMGTPAEAEAAGMKLDQMLTRPGAEKIYAEFAKTHAVLAPASGLGGFTRGLDDLLRRLEPDKAGDERVLVRWSQANAARTDGVAVAEATGVLKADLGAKPADQRAPDLVSLYLGTHVQTSDHLAVWAARHLRRDVLESPDPIRDALGVEFETVVGDDSLEDMERDLIGVKAVQAIVYLRLPPTKPQIDWYSEALTRDVVHLNFLWDDPED